MIVTHRCWAKHKAACKASFVGLVQFWCATVGCRLELEARSACRDALAYLVVLIYESARPCIPAELVNDRPNVNSGRQPRGPTPISATPIHVFPTQKHATLPKSCSHPCPAMAEVFGVVSAAIGLLDVSSRGIGRLHQVVKTWSNAPVELHQLEAEVGDLRYLIDEVRRTQVAIEAAARQDTAFVAVLEEHLQKAQDYFHELDDILDEMSKFKKYKKKSVWVQREGRVKKLRSELSQVRRHINSLLVAHNV